MANQAINRPLGGIVGELAKLGVDVVPDANNPASTTIAFTGPMSIESGGSLDVESGASLKIGGTAIGASAAELNHLQYADKMTKVVKVALAAVDTGGGVFAWQNTEESAAIIILRVTLDVTTASSGACTVNVGTTATSATTSSDNLIDGLDVNSAAGVFDNVTDGGTNGKSRQKLADDKWVTGSVATGASAGIVGSAYIEYMVA